MGSLSQGTGIIRPQQLSLLPSSHELFLKFIFLMTMIMIMTIVMIMITVMIVIMITIRCILR